MTKVDKLRALPVIIHREWENGTAKRMNSRIRLHYLSCLGIPQETAAPLYVVVVVSAARAREIRDYYMGPCLIWPEMKLSLHDWLSTDENPLTWLRA